MRPRLLMLLVSCSLLLSNTSLAQHQVTGSVLRPYSGIRPPYAKERLQVIGNETIDLECVPDRYKGPDGWLTNDAVREILALQQVRRYTDVRPVSTAQEKSVVEHHHTIKVVMFDLFNTVFDMKGINTDEIRDYVNQVKADFDSDVFQEWKPLSLPAHWSKLPAFPDSRPGIEKLKQKFTVVTMSNAPLGLQGQLSRNSGISWHMTIPLELKRTYKPKPAAYQMVIDLLGVKPEQVLMVTANETFGDLEAARALGMKAVLIRSETGPKDILDLYDYLEAMPRPEAIR